MKILSTLNLDFETNDLIEYHRNFSFIIQWGVRLSENAWPYLKLLTHEKLKSQEGSNSILIFRLG